MVQIQSKKKGKSLLVTLLCDRALVRETSVGLGTAMLTPWSFRPPQTQRIVPHQWLSELPTILFSPKTGIVFVPR